MLNGSTWRAWVSPLVAIAFVVVAVTGILMLGHGIGGHAVRGLHEVGGITFAVAGIFHTALNWRALVARCRNPVVLLSMGCVVVFCAIALVLPEPQGASDRDHRNGPRALSGIPRSRR